MQFYVSNSENELFLFLIKFLNYLQKKSQRDISNTWTHAAMCKYRISEAEVKTHEPRGSDPGKFNHMTSRDHDYWLNSCKLL